MKWFKHQTDSIHSEKLNWLIDNFGMEGYGRWFRLLEIVAERMDESDRCSAEFSLQKWAAFLFGKQFKVISFLEQIQNKMEIKLESNGNILKITVPKLLEKRDNYTKNLQATDKKLASIEVDKKKIRKEDKNIYTPTFLEFWEIYPKKEAKKEAAVAFGRLKPESVFELMATIKNGYKWNPDPKYIPNPASWLNGERWKDLQYHRPKAVYTPTVLFSGAKK